TISPVSASNSSRQPGRTANSTHQEICIALSRCSAGATRYRLVPAGQTGQLGFQFYVREAAADVDGDQRGDVSNSKAIAGNKFMAIEFAVHPFETLIGYRALCFSVFREIA